MTHGRVAVIGAGTMGSGIAQSFLAADLGVVLVDREPAILDRALERIASGLRRQWHERPDADEAVAAALAQLETVPEVPERTDLDLVVEAVPENVELKSAVLRAIDARCGTDAVVATNTSSLSVDQLATVLADPSRFIGMHFFNPVPRSALIELVTGTTTSDVTLTAARRWVEVLGKTAIVVSDSPGFATSRLGLALGLEAIRMVEEGVASADDIDTGMVLGYKHPVGPLRLTDIVGLDVRLGIAEHLAATLGPRFEPPTLLREMVADGKLGQKVGEGFYRWP